MGRITAIMGKFALVLARRGARVGRLRPLVRTIGVILRKMRVVVPKIAVNMRMNLALAGPKMSLIRDETAAHRSSVARLARVGGFAPV